MVIKSSEETLKAKAEYYQKNKAKILARKHSRQAEIYQNKINRNLTSEKEFDKEFMRKLSKLDNIRPDACELCGKKASELNHLLELHHMSYTDTKGVWVCKPCHASLDMLRRREE